MPNRLAQETSPYLQQHADNPVDWFPWGEEALTRARELNKPILLSIGYSACHWCHVMAHESFEDADVAAVMNQHFINIKVDREERPDLDHIYQAAHNMLTQRNGGWPLTLFLTPDQVPFFGGTYFPKQARYNLPGFVSLLKRVAELYRTRQDGIAKQSASLLQVFGTSLPSAENQVSFNKTSLEEAFSGLQQSFDPIHGGFGGAPKFPLPTEMEFLLRFATRGGNPDAHRMVLHTLRKMADGGIYDQLGGGFVATVWMNAGKFLILKKCYMTMAHCWHFIPMRMCCQAKHRSNVWCKASRVGSCVRCSRRKAVIIPAWMRILSMRKASFMCGRRSRPQAC